MSWLLERLHKYKENRGVMANLRCVLVANKRHRAWPVLHCLGISADDGNGITAFVAGLFATHPQDSKEVGNFGTTCEAIQNKRGERHGNDTKLTPTERRFQHLLAAERSELQDRVLRMVLMAKSQNIPVNYEKLQTDMKYWGDGIKNQWASAFWAPSSEALEED